jgi:hypothetical protein
MEKSHHSKEVEFFVPWAHNDPGCCCRPGGSLSSIAESNASATEEMAATIRETTRTVDDLSQLAERLNSLVARFKV